MILSAALQARQTEIPLQSRLHRASAWLVDWDVGAGLQEWREHPELFDELHIFAVYFNEAGEPIPPSAWAPYWDELHSWRRAAPNRSLWITLVNDRKSGAQSIQKDPTLVTGFIETEEQRRRHISELVSIARAHKADGIELDYEHLRPEDWPPYLRFVEEAREFLENEGIGLQVVLQPQQIPLRGAPPTLLRTVMSYNLFGMHSGPGPKNTPDLVQRIAQWIGANRTSGFRIAFATGGYDWVGEKVVRQLRESDALQIQQNAGASIQRGPHENAHFAYTDKQGVAHQVWFEDGVSLRRQWEAASKAGFTELALWRLGGNSPELFAFLRAQKEEIRR